MPDIMDVTTGEPVIDYVFPKRERERLTAGARLSITFEPRRKGYHHALDGGRDIRLFRVWLDAEQGALVTDTPQGARDYLEHRRAVAAAEDGRDE